MKFRFALILAVVLFSPLSFGANGHAKHITGIYSNLHYVGDAGDLVGTELVIVPAEKDYKVFFQLSEGGFPFTALATLKVTGSDIEFTLPPGGDYGGMRFKGTIKGNDLTLHPVLPAGDGMDETLKRGKSYWQ